MSRNAVLTKFRVSAADSHKRPDFMVKIIFHEMLLLSQNGMLCSKYAA